MHMNVGEALDLAASAGRVAAERPDVEVGVAPPFTALSAVAEKLRGSKLALAAQNCYFEPSGAFTGEVSAPMLRDVGCTHVIVGHSERRQYFGDDDSLVNRKVKAVFASALTPVVCIGENLAEREAGQTFDVVGRQLRGALDGLTADQVGAAILAYEPVWAIGTGRTATNEQAQEVHGFLRAQLAELFGAEAAGRMRIQYGGSVKPDNVAGLMAQPDVDGALVGGASLKADSFAAIVKYERSSL